MRRRTGLLVLFLSSVMGWSKLFSCFFLLMGCAHCQSAKSEESMSSEEDKSKRCDEFYPCQDDGTCTEDDVIVCFCNQTLCKDASIDLRLVDGRYPNEGRLEVRLSHEETWGSYCSNENPFFTGRVACRQLGFPALLFATTHAQFGQGTGPIRIENIRCRQESLSMYGCSLQEWYPTYKVCDHRFDVGLTCFTGNIRLVGSQRENEGRVEVHLRGDEWASLSLGQEYQYLSNSDLICKQLGYPFSVGFTREAAYDVNQTICKYGSCHFGGESSIFECIDRLVVEMCPDQMNSDLLGVVCATEVLSIETNMEFRLFSTTSQHAGIVEGRYNESGWKTVCINGYDDNQLRTVLEKIFRRLRHGYPGVSDFWMIPYSNFSGYVSTGDELILRQTFLEGQIGTIKWTQGQHACQTHNYKLVFMEFETGVTLFGLTVFPCRRHSCRDRCGSPSNEDLCGCDAVCARCNDCCYDYNEQCSLPQDFASLSGSFSCKIIDDLRVRKRVVVVRGCPADWDNHQVELQCKNDSFPGPITYSDGMVFQNVYCAECNGVSMAYELLSTMPPHINQGISECSNGYVNLQIRNGCQMYAGPIYNKEHHLKYKNLHCAYCNGVNISGLNNCVFPNDENNIPDFSHALILLGRNVDSWIPVTYTALDLLDKIKCNNIEFHLIVQPVDTSSVKDEEDVVNESLIADVTRCYILTLGWQNIQLTWPFYVSLRESNLRAGGVQLITKYLTNITEFEDMLDQTLLIPHSSGENGSLRYWIVKCGVGKVDFIEVCGTNVDHIQPSCMESEYTVEADIMRVFNISGVQIVYIGDGQLIEARSISNARIYRYPPNLLHSSLKDTNIIVCGERFENAECKIPSVEETKKITLTDGVPVIKYKGKEFSQDNVIFLPDNRILICSNFFLTLADPSISLSDPLTLLNTVGYILSIIALFATFSNYCVFPVLRNVPGGTIMSLMACLLAAQLMTLTVLDKTDNQAFCIGIAALVHYLWLSTFTWMNALAFHLLKTFTSNQVTPPNKKKSFIAYCLYGWCVPLIIVLICLVIHFTNGQRFGFQYGGERSCWLVGEYAILGAFGAPMIASLIGNAVMFGWTVRSVHASLVSAAMVRAGKSKTKETVRELWIYSKISCVMGFTWIFGCLATVIDRQALWYLFVIANSLQGVFIFMSFGCNLRIRVLWRDKLGIQHKRPQEKRQTHL